MDKFYEHKLSAESDGKDYPVVWWFICGILFGPFVIPFVYLMGIKTDIIHYRSFDKDLDQLIYLQEYERQVKKRRIAGTLFGWVTWLGLVILYAVMV